MRDDHVWFNFRSLAMNCAGTRLVLRCSTNLLKKCGYRGRILRPTSSSTYDFEGFTHFSLSTMTRECKDSSDRQSMSTKSDDLDYEEESPYANVDYAALTGNDPVALKKLKALQLEMYMRHQRGDTVPEVLTTAQWAQLLDISNSSVRDECLERFWIDETRKKKDTWQETIISDLLVAKQTVATAEELTEVTTCSPVIYSLDHNTLFPSRSDVGICWKFQNYKLHLAAMYGAPMIVDCSYESVLSEAGLYSCVEEIKRLWYTNQRSLIPFHIVFCNLDPAGKLRRKIREYFPRSNEPEFPFFHTYKSPVELYPEENFVFLVPFAREHLREYDPNSIYVIDIVDRFVENESLGRVKAKAYRGNLAKIPLNKKLQWCITGTDLSPRMVVGIMNEVKNTPEWKYSFKRMATALEIESDGGTDGRKNNIPPDFSLKSALFNRVNERFRRNKAYDLLLKT